MGTILDRLAGFWRFLAWLGSIVATGVILFAVDLVLEWAFGETISLVLLTVLVAGFSLGAFYYTFRKEWPDLGQRGTLLRSVWLTGAFILFAVTVTVVLVWLPAPS